VISAALALCRRLSVNRRTQKAGQVTFSTQQVTKVDEKVIRQLKQEALAAPGGNIRLCLHRDTDDAVHEMIIVRCKGGYVRPHKHDSQIEAFHIIEGGMLVVLFDEQGKVTERFKMREKATGNCFVCRIEKGRWHTMVPLTEQVVFLETTQGPFRAETHNTFPPWAPENDDQAAIDRFMKSILT